MIETHLILLSTHETCSLFQVPCALRLIKDNDVINRRPRIDECFITEVMDVLNERLDTLGNFSLPDIFSQARRRSISSRVKASRRTATSGPFPDRNTA